MLVVTWQDLFQERMMSRSITPLPPSLFLFSTLLLPLPMHLLRLVLWEFMSDMHLLHRFAANSNVLRSLICYLLYANDCDLVHHTVDAMQVFMNHISAS